VSARASRSGFTLVELLLALGLLSLLMIVVFQLFDRSLSLWERGETQRSLLEQGAAVGELLARDLASLEGGPRGDLVCEWVGFDTDGDQVRDTFWPRLVLVREAGAAEVARRHAVGLLPGASARLEVVWCVAPASTSDPDAHAEGVLWRGEQLATMAPGAAGSFFEPSFFPRSNQPPTDRVEEVSTGLIWLSFELATQTSIVHDGWKLGDGPEDAVASWDAWSLARPDPEVHAWNEPPRSAPRPRGRALLPRRVRVEIEIERPADRRRRTRLAAPVEAGDASFNVEDGRRLPRGEDALVLVDGEWMGVVSVTGDRVQVRRGLRATGARRHAAGAMLHYGQRLVREVPVATYREDWDL
jgi:prepilin-type N-terminal cleavage/methylation domain-containing protein